MELKDYITTITAIVGAVLGIFKLILKIQSKFDEKIILYCDNLEIKYKIKGTEEFYENAFIKIPLKINYYFDILDNKNKTVPVEDVYIYTTYNETLDIYLFNSEYL